MAKALSRIPESGNSKIPDIGSGTGIPTLWLAENSGGIITATDTYQLARITRAYDKNGKA
jgi:methylase of polypeptide subunit release factors